MKKTLSFKSGMLLTVVLLICSSVFAAGPRSDSKQGLTRGQAAVDDLKIVALNGLSVDFGPLIGL